MHSTAYPLVGRERRSLVPAGIRHNRFPADRCSAIVWTPARAPGVSPESLASLTGLSPSMLGPAVSGLVQAGDLVRDGWLVRLPQAEDLLPSRLAEPDRGAELRHASERRAIGDRRAVGERRLYERRQLS